MGRYDTAFKLLEDGSPLTLLELFGRAPLPPGTKVTPVDRELVMSIKTIDHAYLLEAGSTRWLEHFEAETVISTGDLEQIACRALLLSYKYSAPVWTTLVLLARRMAPAVIPAGETSEERGCLTLSARLRIVKLWELDPDMVLSKNDPALVPLVGGMRATNEQLERAIRLIDAVPDRERRSELFGTLVTWSSLSYNEARIRERYTRMNLTKKEFFLMAPIGQEILEFGREEGRTEGLRESVLDTAEMRFPGLLAAERLTAIDYAILKQLLREVAAAPDRETAAMGINRLLPPA